MKRNKRKLRGICTNQKKIINCIKYRYKTKIQISKEVGFDCRRELRKLLNEFYIKKRIQKNKPDIPECYEFKLDPAFIQNPR